MLQKKQFDKQYEYWFKQNAKPGCTNNIANC